MRDMFFICFVLQLNGYTALNHVAFSGYVEIATLLINNGCDLNATNNASCM